MVSQVPEMEHNDSHVQDQQDVDRIIYLNLKAVKGQEKLKIMGQIFLFILSKGPRDPMSSCVPDCFNVESDPLTCEEAMSSPNAFLFLKTSWMMKLLLSWAMVLGN